MTTTQKAKLAADFIAVQELVQSTKCTRYQITYRPGGRVSIGIHIQKKIFGAAGTTMAEALEDLKTRILNAQTLSNAS